jgi:hypothetical protein
LKSLAILRLHVRYGICRLFRYASDFIWWLGKNDLEKLRDCRLLPIPTIP